MIEENVVSAAGARFRFTADAIRDAGYVPQLRNQQYGFRDVPKNIVNQNLDKEAIIVD